jgi:hypothetical protein
MTEIIVILLFSVILMVQLYVLVKMRRTMGQVSLFLRALHRVFKEFSRVNEEAVQSLRDSQQLLEKFPQAAIRASRSRSCKNCVNRLSFVKIGDGTLAFEYQCRLDKKTIHLTDTCEHFSLDQHPES